ncbi:hypothetical protein D3C78_1652290 [compost metagenome]
MIEQHLHQFSICPNRHLDVDLRLCPEKRGQNFRDTPAGRWLRCTDTHTTCLPIQKIAHRLIQIRVVLQQYVRTFIKKTTRFG